MRLLPWTSRLRFGLGVHIHIHSSLQRAKAGDAGPATSRKMNRQALWPLSTACSRPFADCVGRHRPKAGRATTKTILTPRKSFSARPDWSPNFSSSTESHSVWDLGANTGYFSHLASGLGRATTAFDYDPACVERMYLEAKQRQETNLLPLVVDLFNPSPPSGLAKPGAVVDLRSTKTRPCSRAGSRASPGFHRQSTAGKLGVFLQSTAPRGSSLNSCRRPTPSRNYYSHAGVEFIIPTIVIASKRVLVSTSI